MRMIMALPTGKLRTVTVSIAVKRADNTYDLYNCYFWSRSPPERYTYSNIQRKDLNRLRIIQAPLEML